MIGRFWILHHRFFASVIGFDARLLGLNLFYLGWIALLLFSSQVLGDHGGDSAATVLYAINFSGATMVGMLMSADARRAGLSKMPRRRRHVKAAAGRSSPRFSSRRSRSR